MKAKEYLRTIQKLESETKECYGQAEYLKNSINTSQIRMPLKPLRNLSLTLWTRRLITQFIVFI